MGKNIELVLKEQEALSTVKFWINSSRNSSLRKKHQVYCSKLKKYVGYVKKDFSSYKNEFVKILTFDIINNKEIYLSEFKTSQEKFWYGEFGDQYSSRVRGEKLLSSYISMHSSILKKIMGIKTIIEFGSNIGINLDAYRTLIPEAHLSAVEINPKAVLELKQNQNINKVYSQSLFDFKVDYQRDLVLIKTVLIHIDPSHLEKVYEILYNTSRKYICIAEYYSPYPDEVEYRGYRDKLFKRDFAGDMLDKFKDLCLTLDYGFIYHRDAIFPLGDVNWFLLEKNN